MELYKGQAGSPIATLVSNISDTDNEITISNGLAVPEAPNLATIWVGSNFETIRYGAKSGDVLSDITRGIESTARAWGAGTKLARFYTAHDQDAITGNINALKDEVDAHLNEYATQADVVMKNIIVNGNFSQGPAGWGSWYSSNAISNGNLVNTGDGTNTQPQTYSTFFERIAGNKYYTRVVWRVTNPDCIALAISGIGNLSIPNPLANQWYITSTVFSPATSTDSFLQLNHTYSSVEASLGKSSEVKNAKIIDITASFGADNEPTKEEMDALISLVPNQWWDGELKPSQKLLLNWQLKMIRQNRNAIVALGGTIV